MARSGTYLGGSTIVKVNTRLFVGKPPKRRIGIVASLAPSDPSQFIGETRVERAESARPAKIKEPKVSKAPKFSPRKSFAEKSQNMTNISRVFREGEVIGQHGKKTFQVTVEVKRLSKLKPEAGKG